ncbi:MAG: hypothetical protein DRJ47_05315 [Thermoprotei archaeon]|nr:MAG: hypothetical protein DRJ47_05315 [Thermoprotei archaeon]
MGNLAFVIKSYTAVTAPTFSLKSPATTGGRLDVIIRSILAAFSSPKGLRKNIIFYSILAGPPNPPITLEFNGEKMNMIFQSEEEVAKIILESMKGCEIDGVRAFKADLNEVLRTLSLRNYNIFYLHEEGTPIKCSDIQGDEKKCFVLGDQLGLSPSDEKIVSKYMRKKISLGPLSYLSSFCVITILYIIHECQRISLIG